MVLKMLTKGACAGVVWRGRAKGVCPLLRVRVRVLLVGVMRVEVVVHDEGVVVDRGERGEVLGSVVVGSGQGADGGHLQHPAVPVSFVFRIRKLRMSEI